MSRTILVGENERPRYVIINKCDAPQRSQVCQLIEGVGYCYMERNRWRKSFDGMSGKWSTPVESFGFSIREGDYEIVFKRVSESTATYDDGKPRHWQGVDEFTLPRVTRSMIRVQKDRV